MECNMHRRSFSFSSEYRPSTDGVAAQLQRIELEADYRKSVTSVKSMYEQSFRDLSGFPKRLHEQLGKNDVLKAMKEGVVSEQYVNEHIQEIYHKSLLEEKQKEIKKLQREIAELKGEIIKYRHVALRFDRRSSENPIFEKETKDSSAEKTFIGKTQDTFMGADALRESNETLKAENNRLLVELNKPQKGEIASLRAAYEEKFNMLKQKTLDQKKTISTQEKKIEVYKNSLSEMKTKMQKDSQETMHGVNAKHNEEPYRRSPGSSMKHAKLELGKARGKTKKLTNNEALKNELEKANLLISTLEPRKPGFEETLYRDHDFYSLSTPEQVKSSFLEESPISPGMATTHWKRRTSGSWNSPTLIRQHSSECYTIVSGTPDSFDQKSSFQRDVPTSLKAKFKPKQHLSYQGALYRQPKEALFTAISELQWSLQQLRLFHSTELSSMCNSLTSSLHEIAIKHTQAQDSLRRCSESKLSTILQSKSNEWDLKLNELARSFEISSLQSTGDRRQETSAQQQLIETIQKRYNEIRSELSVTIGLNSSLELQLDHLEHSLQTVSEDKKSLENQLSSASSQYTALQLEINRLTQSLSSAHETAAKQLKFQAKQEFRAQLTQMTQALSESQQQNSLLAAKLASASQEHSNEISSLTRKYQALLDSLQQKLLKEAEANSALQRALQKALEDSNLAKLQQNALIQRLQDEADSLNSQLSGQKEIFSSFNSHHHSELSTSQGKLSEATHELILATQELSKSSIDREKLRTKVNSLHGQIERLSVKHSTSLSLKEAEIAALSLLLNQTCAANPSIKETQELDEETQTLLSQARQGPVSRKTTFSY